MKILIVEDDPKIAELLSTGLVPEGFQVEIAADGLDGFEKARHGVYDLLILDLMLPLLHGLSLLDRLRVEGIASKVLILSAKNCIDDRILGLQKGGDDYLTKPFAFGELLARCQAILRRPNALADLSVIARGDVSLNLLTREVHRSGKVIALRAKELALLELFLRNPGQVMSKPQILEKIWSYRFDPQTNVVDVLVSRLRDRLDRDFAVKTIHTIRGVGYVFRPE